MVRATVVPNGEIILVPLEPDLQVVVFGNVTEQIFENGIGFVLCQLHDSLREPF
jgi:hypothetical protein